MYAQPHPPHGRTIGPELARAFAGLGLLMEYLAHLIQREAGPEMQIPIQLTDVAVGSGERGRESVVIDISEYADPLHIRVIRVPFSVYLKLQGMAGALSEEMIEAVPLMFQIPMFEISETEAIEVMRSAEQTAELATRAPVRIPEHS